MAQNKNANEHYVPKTYLKSFADEKQHCFVYDKQNKKHFITNIENILTEKNLYDFDVELLKSFSYADEQAVEKILGMTIDNYWCNIVTNIENNFGWFSSKYSLHFLDVYRCAVVQLMRTPNGKKELMDIYNEAYAKKCDKKFENVVFAKELLNVFDENMKSVLLEVILNEYGHIIIGINNTEIPFVTSDTPVFVLPNVWDKSKKEKMMYYPITPKRCIFFQKRKYVSCQFNNVLKDVKLGKFTIMEPFDIAQETYRRKQDMLKKLNPETIILKEYEILFCNSCSKKVATRFIISSQNTEQKKLWV